MDNEFLNFDAVIDIEKKKSYNQALEDISKDIETIRTYDIGEAIAYRKVMQIINQLKK